MKHMELEVKILNINKKEFITKLESLGGVLKQKTIQKLYTYDLPTIYSRYIDLVLQLEDAGTNVKYETVISKFELLFFEINNLLSEEDKKILNSIFGNDDLLELLKNKNLLNDLTNPEFLDFIKGSVTTNG